MGGGNSILEHVIRSEAFSGDGQHEPTDLDYEKAHKAWAIIKEVDQKNQNSSNGAVASNHHHHHQQQQQQHHPIIGSLGQKQSILIDFYDGFYALLKQANPDSKICTESMPRKIRFLVDVVKIILMGNTNQHEFSKHIKHFVHKYKEENITSEECET